MVESLGPKGQAVTVGSPGQGQTASINIFHHLVNGRSYMGTHQGDSNPVEVSSRQLIAEGQFIPYLITEHEAGRFPFDRLITSYKLEDYEKANEDLHSGKAIKAVLLWK